MKIMSLENICWLKARYELLINQEELVEVYRINNNEAVKDMQLQIIYSFAARCIAVREVVPTEGVKTPGVDGLFLDSPIKRWQAIL